MKDYSELTSRIYVQLEPELSQEFHNMLTDMAKELSRLEAIENANPSEALECLEYLGTFELETEIVVNKTKAYNTIKQALETKSKKEQAFDIIKAKSVDTDYVITNFMYKDYNSMMDELWGDKASPYYLTEEEFKLLKELLCND